MHEYSLMLALLERVEEAAAAHHALAVHRVCVQVGDLSGVEPELLDSAFGIVRGGTICEHAVLDIERVAARWECATCRRALDAGERLQCPSCGGPAALAAGDELLLGRLELEVP